MRHNQAQWLPGLEPAGPRTRSEVSERVVEICAGAGGQALGLERAGFQHDLAVELDGWPVKTLRHNRPDWDVRQGDVADPTVWNPADYSGVDLLAGGVPCPPFSVAGQQLGANDERDLFAWAVELTAKVQPRALMLENVRGLSMPRFSAYRQVVLDRLTELGYVGDWNLLHASDFGVPQLRPRFILIALRPEDAPYFSWPDPIHETQTVGSALHDLMAARDWPHADAWAAAAQRIGPTVVGGSKKHGGADLGPTRARRAWSLLHVDGRGVADLAPGPDAPHFKEVPPRLTVDMVARIQGWRDEDAWEFAGRKTAQYRQIGNAFPPPLAEVVGNAIISALRHETENRAESSSAIAKVQDPVYLALRESETPLTADDLQQLLRGRLSSTQIMESLNHLSADFDLETHEGPKGALYALSGFRAFTGQENHQRHETFSNRRHRARVS